MNPGRSQGIREIMMREYVIYINVIAHTAQYSPCTSTNNMRKGTKTAVETYTLDSWWLGLER